MGLPLGRRTGERRIVFPEVFSFIDNPEETLDALNEMVSASRWGLGELFLNHRPCQHLDHGAVSVVAALASEARTRRIRVNGNNPEDQIAREIIWSVGAPRVLGYARGRLPEGFISYRLKKVRVFRRLAAERSTPHERVVQEIQKHISLCVERFGHTLTMPSRGRLAGLLGEVCGNAEEHPGRNEWWASAFLRQQNSASGTCYLTIFTFGETMYETLDGSLPPGCLMRRKIEDLVASHADRGLFRTDWSEGNLWTLYALQEGVHRKNHDGDPRGRGNGTVQLMRYFRDLSGGGEDRMCLVSGDTQIVFDGRYWPEKKTGANQDETTVMAFNHANDLQVPPDPRNVRRLQNFFPGTLISLKFELSADHLQRSEETDALHRPR